MYRFLILMFLLFTLDVHSQELPQMIYIPGGSFEMGDSLLTARHNTDRLHVVELDAFCISKTPITISQWKYYCKETNKDMPESPKWGWHDDHPIVNVSWAEAVEYTDWLSFKTGTLCRLPTEAEWEYAAKAKQSNSPVGWNIDNIKSEGTQPVAQFPPNQFGLYDMTGNVWQWCRDWYGWYRNTPQKNPTGPHAGTFRVLRGGSWYNTAKSCRITSRSLYRSSSRADYIGFRVVSIDYPTQTTSYPKFHHNGQL